MNYLVPISQAFFLVVLFRNVDFGDTLHSLVQWLSDGGPLYKEAETCEMLLNSWHGSVTVRRRWDDGDLNQAGDS